MKKKPAGRKAVTKTITIDRLGEMIQGGFIEVGQHIDEVERRIDGVEEKIDALRGEMISMHFDYKTVKARLENVELKVFGSIRNS